MQGALPAKTNNHQPNCTIDAGIETAMNARYRTPIKDAATLLSSSQTPIVKSCSIPGVTLYTLVTIMSLGKEGLPGHELEEDDEILVDANSHLIVATLAQHLPVVFALIARLLGLGLLGKL